MRNKKVKLSAEEKEVKKADNALKITQKVSAGEKLNFNERNILNIIERKEVSKLRSSAPFKIIKIK